MLILSRKPGQTIQIGDEIIVTVLSSQGGQIRLGIEAPKHIAVHREEIYRRAQAEKHSAA